MSIYHSLVSNNDFSGAEIPSGIRGREILSEEKSCEYMFRLLSVPTAFVFRCIR